ncbi:hypothetical protein BAUCODRAFT_123401 [Baudoinia panamericana UAMH 10762]|uniref:Uncharacterized protein n=1 Tax=Baudoinia panamericana (strain UAMH 10762) TaxID=717646 RepID=M2LKU1_BAUPA|nr:uncharacterized protein BAUCODRAFT_123401 [Baudoinia panamericana UAMH 10762]EMC94902.1 hypothetical protein BAUCODRAFT_123401 [Baudoinia panamericana UAMH 10762]
MVEADETTLDAEPEAGIAPGVALPVVPVKPEMLGPELPTRDLVVMPLLVIVVGGGTVEIALDKAAIVEPEAVVDMEEALVVRTEQAMVARQFLHQCQVWRVCIA